MTKFHVSHKGASNLIKSSDGVIGWNADLEQMFKLLPRHFEWRHDDNESLYGIRSEETLQQGMQEILEAFLEDLKAQTIALGWRVEQACEAATHSLNDGALVAFCSLARLALESTFHSMARFEDFATRIRGINNATTAEKWSSEWNLLDETNNSANFGRHRSTGPSYPFKAKSVVSHKDKALKYLFSKGMESDLSAQITSRYEDLCEITHPNAEGLQIYWNLEAAHPIFPGAPSYRTLEFERGLLAANESLPLLSGLWAMGFSAHHATEVFHRLNNLEIVVTGKKSGFGKQIMIKDITGLPFKTV